MGRYALMVTLFVLLLMDIWPLGRFGGAAGTRSGIPPVAASKLLLGKLPLLLLSAVSSVVTIAAQGSWTIAVSCIVLISVTVLLSGSGSVAPGS